MTERQGGATIMQGIEQVGLIDGLMPVYSNGAEFWAGTPYQPLRGIVRDSLSALIRAFSQ
jgi:hypothetical protein